MACQDRPALHERLIGGADIADLDEVIHHREPGEAVALRPLGLGLDGLEDFRRVGAEQQDGLWMPNFMPFLLLIFPSPVIRGRAGRGKATRWV